MKKQPPIPGWDGLTGQALTRRALLARALALGLSVPTIGALLAACGGDDDDEEGTQPPGAASPVATGTVAPAGSPTVAGTTPPSSGQMGERLVIGRNIDDLITFDPAVAYEFSAFPVMWACYQCLLLPDPDDLTAFLPVLCEEVPSAENGGISADGLTYTFKLKQGITFSTGGTLQAKDVVFSAKRLAYLKKNPSFLADPYVEKDAEGNITAVNVREVDEYTVEFALAEPNVAFLAYMASSPGIVYDSEFIKSQGGLDTPEAETQDTATQWFDQHSAGAGPYQLTSWKQTEEIVLEAYPDSALSEPHYGQIVWRHIDTSANQLQQLEAGEIDMADNLDPDAINSLRGKEGFQVIEQPGLAIYYLALHNDPAVGDILSDVRVRQAIAYSIDYDGIINELQSGAAVRPASMIAVGMLGADKLEEFAYQTDIEKAKQLVQEAGAEGKEFTLTYRANPDTEILVTKLQADIERSGLKVRVNPGDPAQVLQDFRDSKLQSIVIQWGPDYLDVHTNAYPFGGVEGVAPARRAGYVNAENAELLAQAIQEQDKARREELYVEIGKNMIEDAAFIPLYQPITQYGAKASVGGITLHPTWFYLLDRFGPA